MTTPYYGVSAVKILGDFGSCEALQVVFVIKTSLGPPSSRISSRIPASRPGRPML